MPNGHDPKKPPPPPPGPVPGGPGGVKPQDVDKPPQARLAVAAGVGGAIGGLVGGLIGCCLCLQHLH